MVGAINPAGLRRRRVDRGGTSTAARRPYSKVCAPSLAHSISWEALIVCGRCQQILKLNGFAALRADGYHGDTRLQQFFQALEIGPGSWRQLIVGSDPRRTALPALHLLIDRLAGGEVVERSGKAVNDFSAQIVGCTDLDGGECIEHIELGNDRGIQAVQLCDEAARHGIEPAAAPLPAGIGAVFVSTVTQRLPYAIEERRWHRPAAHARNIGFVDADHAI